MSKHQNMSKRATDKGQNVLRLQSRKKGTLHYLRESAFHRSQAEYLLLLFSLPHISDISTLIFPLYDAYLIKFHSDG